MAGKVTWTAFLIFIALCIASSFYDPSAKAKPARLERIWIHDFAGKLAASAGIKATPADGTWTTSSLGDDVRDVIAPVWRRADNAVPR